MIRTLTIRSFERGLVYRKGELRSVLSAGTHWVFGLDVRVDVVSLRDTVLEREDLDLVVRSGLLDRELQVVRLADSERLLIWVNGRFLGVRLGALHALWSTFDEVTTEVRDVGDLRFEHARRQDILARSAEQFLDLQVAQEHVGLLYVDGALTDELTAGRHVLWRTGASIRHVSVDLRLQTLDIAGQELMTKDRVTLRLNAVVTWQTVDARAVATLVTDASQALYREAQLALRAAVGTRTLDGLLEDKESLADVVAGGLKDVAAAMGLKVVGFGVRDVILNGEMKQLLNRVTEARKAAEAAAITRREETAQMRSQANTARLLEGNATLMRLRELEVLERIATGGNLQVVLGEKGLGERIMNLI